VKALFDRLSQEDFEEQHLSIWACKSRESKGREKREIPCSLRTSFQRDRDRILHTKAFRRLKHKTQVFIAPFGDHYRTRLTHTLEVAQVARTIARALRLNEDLTEAIALGHDLGHTPFGHAGEEALDEVHPEGFRHNEQSLRVVEKLEGGKGLNLTWEVRDGILNHSEDKAEIYPHTLEGEAVRISDSIAYVNHDIDDAIRAGIIKERDLPSGFLKVLGVSCRERIDTLIRDAVKTSWGSSHLRISEEILGIFHKLKGFMYERVYLAPVLTKEAKKARRIIKDLYNLYLKNIDFLPMSLKKSTEEKEIRRVVVDYIAGMTDQYALNVYKEYFLPKGW